MPGEMSTPRTLAAGLGPRVQVGRHLAGPGRDVEQRGRRAAAPLSSTARFRQRGSWNAEMTRFIGS